MRAWRRVRDRVVANSIPGCSELGIAALTHGDEASFAFAFTSRCHYPGSGTSYLAHAAIAYRAIQNGFEARFVDADALLEQLSRASQRDHIEFALEEYLHPHVLVID